MAGVTGVFTVSIDNAHVVNIGKASDVYLSQLVSTGNITRLDGDIYRRDSQYYGNTIASYKQDYFITHRTNSDSVIFRYNSNKALVLQDYFSITEYNGTFTFGHSLACHNGILVASDPFGTGKNGFKCGNAYIYTINNDSLVLNQRFYPVGSKERQQKFGDEVVIFDDYIILTSSSDDYDENEYNYLINAGSALIIKYSSSWGWVWHQKICSPTRLASSAYGANATKDSNLLLISAPSYNSGYGEGSVFTYKLTNDTWVDQQEIIPTGTNAHGSDQFGIGLSAYSGIVAVGANYHRYDEDGYYYTMFAGAVWIFKRDGDNYIQHQKLCSPKRTVHKYFGESLELGIINNQLTLLCQAQHPSTGDLVISFTYDGQDFSYDRTIIPSGLNAYSGTALNNKFGDTIHIGNDLTMIADPYSSYDRFGKDYQVLSGAVWVYNNSNNEDPITVPVEHQNTPIIVDAFNKIYLENSKTVLPIFKVSEELIGNISDISLIPIDSFFATNFICIQSLPMAWLAGEIPSKSLKWVLNNRFTTWTFENSG